MIRSREEFAKSYCERCLAVDGYVVMKSSIPFAIGQMFGGAASALLGSINAHMVVAAESSAGEAQEQAKRIANISLRPVDLRARYYYRIAPRNRDWQAYYQ